MENNSQIESAWIVDGIDLNRPSVARMYNYLLGGCHNFEIDCAIIAKTREIYPDVALAAQVGRAFLRRVVLYLLDKGINQFIDLGSGIPTAGHVHEILQAANINGRVVYVDIEPMAIAHSNAILRNIPNTLALLEDARRPEEIYAREDIFFEQPERSLIYSGVARLTQ